MSDRNGPEYAQGQDWPDHDILTENGFNVLPAPSYDSNFGMLLKSRANFFPRSVIEIWDEEAFYKFRGVRVEPTKLLIYPTAFYYFLNYSNKILANAINEGLEIAIRDGSFDSLFYEYHRLILKKTNFKERQKFYLKNILLPEATPLARKELWFSNKIDSF